MGMVYEAQDLRLPRSVALKFVKPALSGDADAMRRFRREARLASSLNHPNICTILGVDEHEGLAFIAMELLEGQTLKTLAERGPLPEADVVDLALQVSSALGAAHDHGIMHRDITPGNVFRTTDGRIKVLDFGLAKQFRALRDDAVLSDDVTQAGQAPGTVHFMAPEQFLPGAAIDHRCDLFSLGAVLYLAATGSRPFDGGTRQELVSAIRDQRHTPVRQLAAHISPDLAAIIERLLEKAPEARIPHAAALRDHLNAVRTREPVAAVRAARNRSRSRTALAVLPFRTLGTPTEVSDAFRQGLAEDLAHALAARNDIDVVPGSITRHSPDALTPALIRTRNIGVAIEGTVQELPGRLRVIASAVDASDASAVLASVRVDRAPDDLLAVQQDVAREIAAALAAPVKAATGRGSRSVEAENAYRRGQYHWKDCFAGGWQRALEHYKIAIERDAEFAAAHVAEAAVYNFLGFYCILRPTLAFKVARQAGRQALAVDGSSASAHLECALATFGGDWDWDGAEESFRHALELEPEHFLAHTYYAWLLVFLGRTDVAIAEADAGFSLAPQSRLAACGLAQTLYLARRYADAMAICDRCLERDPTYVFAVHLRGQCRQMLGDLAGALQDMEHAAALTGRAPFYLALLGHCYGVSDRQAEAERLLDEFAAMEARALYVPPHCYVYTLAGLGRWNEALVHQERAYADGASPFNYFTPNVRGLFALEPGQRDRLRQMRLAV